MQQDKKVLLRISNLKQYFPLKKRGLFVKANDGITLDIYEGEVFGLVGESGCGKSLTSLALGGLVDRARITGEIVGRPRIAYVFQNPMQSLDPVMKVGAQIEEGMRGRPSREERRRRVVELLESVGLPADAARKYPCELSGGQQQRVMIASALAQDPELLVADEPTTALDVTTQKEVLDLIARIADERKMAVLLITHNLGLVSAYSREVYVMYAGEVVESGAVAEVLAHPRHPYTKGLLAAVPRLDAPRDAPLADIPGTVPPPWDWPKGCAFHPRCPKAVAACSADSFVRCPLV